MSYVNCPYCPAKIELSNSTVDDDYVFCSSCKNYIPKTSFTEDDIEDEDLDYFNDMGV